MNRTVVLWVVAVAAVVTAGLVLYYGTKLASEPISSPVSPTTPTVPSATAELDAATTQNDTDLSELEAALEEYDAVDPTQDNTLNL
jgi:hypothetical protein